MYALRTQREQRTELLTIKDKEMVEMTKLRVNEAIARAQTAGIKVYKKEVAARLWEGRTESAQQVNMTNLCNGTTKQIRPEWVVIICEMSNCTPNYLFGYEE